MILAGRSFLFIQQEGSTALSIAMQRNFKDLALLIYGNVSFDPIGKPRKVCESTQCFFLAKSERFSLKCRLPKTTSIALTNHSLGWQSKSQSEVETNSLGYQARETACEKLTVGFYVTPDFWLVKQARNSSNANSFAVQIRVVLGQSLEALNLLALRSVDYKRINSHNIKQRE